MARRPQPLVPGFGGTTSSGLVLPEMVALIWKMPLGVFLIWTLLTALFSYLESLYLKPLTASPLQNGLPVMPLTPLGRVYTCNDELIGPLARTVSVAPVAVGLPTMLALLPFSFAFNTTLRL